MPTLDEVLALLPDNSTGQIDAADVRAAVTALWHRTDGTASIEGLTFDPAAATLPVGAGRVQWNPALATLDVDSGTGPVLQVGYESVFRARNMSGATIPNGAPVQIVGATGDRPRVALDNGQGRVAGVATEAIANNADGRVTALGTVNDLNTAAFTEGAFLFVNAAGALTTALSASFVGIVTRVNANVGALYVRPASFRNPFGPTAQRPVSPPPGYLYFDTTLGRPLWWNGAAWVDATGTPV